MILLRSIFIVAEYKGENMLYPYCLDNAALGLLILRVGIGLIFMRHGFAKLLGGRKTLVWVGSQMSHFGIFFAPLAWGILAACAEGFGGLALVLGLGTRIAAFFMTIVMLVALRMHLVQGDDWNVYSYSLAMIVVFVACMIAGGGFYSLDTALFCR
jgi:putative oxidoreductase